MQNALRAVMLISTTLFYASSSHSAEDAPAFRIHIFAGRPLAVATTFLATHFGEQISFEESSYISSHPLAPMFPNGPMLAQPVRVNFEYEFHRGVSVALEQAVLATAKVLPERYRVERSPLGILHVVPDAEDSQSPSPMVIPIDLPLENSPTNDALVSMVSQISSRLPNTRVEIDSVPIRLSRQARVGQQSYSTSRELMDSIVNSWSEVLSSKEHRYTWTLQFAPEMSRSEQRTFVLGFMPLSPVVKLKENRLVVESKHPLSDAVRILGEYFEIPVMLEEAPVHCNCAFVGEAGTKNIDLAGGRLVLQWGENESFADVIANLLQVHTISYSVFAKDIYEISWVGRHAILVPNEMRTGESDFDRYDAILSAVWGEHLVGQSEPISLNQVAQIVSAVSSRRIEVGGAVGKESDFPNFVATQADPVTVEDFLLGLLDQNRKPVSFHLLYDPVIDGHRLVPGFF